MQIYQARQVYEEAPAPPGPTSTASRPSASGEIATTATGGTEINGKIQIANRRPNSILRADIDLTDRDELQNFLIAYIFFAGIFEDAGSINGFSPIFALSAAGLMKGAPRTLLLHHARRVLHASFSIRVAKRIMLGGEHPTRHRGGRRYGPNASRRRGPPDILRDPILGYSKETTSGSFASSPTAGRNLGLDEPHPGRANARPLDEQANLRKERTFETRVTEYQAGGLG